MPTYEYHCPKCGVFEQFHSISTVLTDCPTCGSKVRRLISRNNNVIFKGSGFYTTDYKSGDNSAHGRSKAAPDKSSSTKSAESDKTDAKADIKAAGESKSGSTASSSTKNESKAS